MDNQGGPERAGSLVVELAARTVIVDGTRVELPPTEFSLLAVLAARAGEVVNHKELLQEAFGDSAYMNTQDLHWRIWNIRKLVGDGDKKIIRNRRGVGFVLESSRVEVLDGLAETPTDAPAHVIRLEPEAPAPGMAPPVHAARETTEESRRPLLVLSPAALVIVALVAALVLGGSWLAGYTLSQRTEPPATAAAPPPEVGNPEDKPDQEVKKKEKRPDRRPAKKRDRPRKQQNAPRSQGSPNFAVGPSGSVVSEDVTSGNQPVAPSNDSQDPQPKSDGPSKQEQARPAPPPPPQPNAQLYHLHHPDTGDHIMTTSSSVANQKQAAGYASTPAGGVFTSQVKGTVAIALDGGTAYVYSSPSSAPDEVRVTALYRLSSGEDFFYTTSSSAANQAQAQGWGRSTAGYVAT